MGSSLQIEIYAGIIDFEQVRCIIQANFRRMRHMWKKWLKSNWRRLLIVVASFVFILDRQIWHKIQFDAVTIGLIVVIALFLLFPNPQIIFPYVKRIKLWEVEIELKEQIRELEKEVVKAQDASANEAVPGTPGRISSEVEEVLSESGKNPRAALLLLSAKIEREVKERLRDAGVTLSRRNATASLAVDAGVKTGIFTREFASAFRDFWTVRNRIAHGEAFDVNDNTILSLISLGTELLKVISTEKTS
jgi:hypothetical protein